MTTTRTLRRATAGVAVLSAGLTLAACGSDGGSDAGGTGGGGVRRAAHLHLRRHRARVQDRATSRRSTPTSSSRTATFESNDEAAAKIKAGFHDRRDRGLPRRAGPAGRRGDARADRHLEARALGRPRPDVPRRRRRRDRAATSRWCRPRPAPSGLIYDKDEFPDGVDSWADLFDPEYAGRVALDGGYWLTPFAIMALANGSTDPMDAGRRRGRRDPRPADRPARRRPLPGLRPVRRRHGQPVQVRRDRALRRRSRHAAGHRQGRRQRRLGGARGGRALVGVRAEHQLGGREHRRGLRLHQRRTPRPRRRRCSATTAS